MAKYRTRPLTVDASLSPAGLWIVTNPDGWAFTVHPQVFAATYEPAQEPRPMALRFGPRLDHTIPTEPGPGPEPTPDRLPVEIEAGIDSASPIGDGLFVLNVVAAVPPYSTDLNKRLLKVYAVAVPQGQPLPETPQAFLDSPNPSGIIDVADRTDGHRQVFPIHGVPAANVIQFILQDED